MMSTFTGASDSPHKIEIESKEMNIVKPQDEEPAIQWPSECCIYKVPLRLRKVNKKAYTPRLISIGPIHLGKSELKDMEMLKQRYCDNFFLRQTEKAKEEFESFIEENKVKICKCYAEEIILPCGKEFVNMILRDSIFIIELFRLTAKKKKNKKNESKDYILSKPWLKIGIKNDLILLENQLPLFILNDLYNQSGDKECFIKLACIYFDHPTPEELSPEMKGVKHFTDLYRTFYRPPHSNLHEPSQHQFKVLLYTAKKLQDNAGLIFQKFDEKQFEGHRGLLEIQLNSSCLSRCFESFSCFKYLQNRLVVPQLVIEDGTEEVFRNLMALEQYHYPGKAYICDYIVLLDCLINGKEDVELLVDKGIIVNLLGSNQAVASMVNKLCLEIVQKNLCYRHIAIYLNDYYNSRWNQNMATLRNVYFRNIWRSTATFARGLALVITILNFLRPFVFTNT